jgi:4'-phosphopantetheinyl transferase EntD
MMESTPDPILSVILPSEVAAAEIRGEFPITGLLPEEMSLLGPQAVEKRRRELTAGRLLARRALEKIGVAPVAILAGEKREPLWPTGVVGSITHTFGYGAAAVAPAARFSGIGIDAEVHEPLPDGVLRMIARPEEQAWLEKHADDDIRWDRLLFCAKESVYKVWYPLMHRWLGFEDATVLFDRERGTFRAQLVGETLLIDGRAVTALEGRFLADEQHVLTTIAVERVTR